MKKKWIFAVVLAVLLGLCLLLNMDASGKADLSGAWYRAGAGECWNFEEGLLYRVDGEAQSFAGAYTFAGETVSLFLLEDGRVGNIVELSLVHDREGDCLVLRESPESVWFCRSLEDAMKQ